MNLRSGWQAYSGRMHVRITQKSRVQKYYPHKGEAGRPSLASLVRTYCLLAALISFGCGETPEPNDAYRLLEESDRQLREAVRIQTQAGTESKAAIQLVQQWPAPNGEGAVSNWVDRLLSDSKADSLFPRWTARETAYGRYEVYFTWLRVEPNGRTHPVGYSWTADLALQLVTGPRALTEDQLRSLWRGRTHFPLRSNPDTEDRREISL